MTNATLTTLALALWLVALGCGEDEPPPAEPKTAEPAAVPAAVLAASEETANPVREKPKTANPVRDKPKPAPAVAEEPETANEVRSFSGRRSLDVVDRTQVGWANLAAAMFAVKQGMAHHKHDRHHQALRQFELAIGVDPNQVEARYGFARTHTQMGHRDKALARLAEMKAMDGHTARRLLAGAGKDTELITLWRDPKFIEITAVEAPVPVWSDGPDLDVTIVSDPFEVACIWLEPRKLSEACSATTLKVASCATGERIEERKVRKGSHCRGDKAAASAAEIDDWLQALGVVEWEQLDGDDETAAWKWYAEHLSQTVERNWDEETLEAVYRSPKGSTIAFRHAKVSDKKGRVHASYSLAPASKVLGD